MAIINLSKTSNPVLTEKRFGRERIASSEAMTVNGTINKTALMLLLVVAAAMFTWNKFFGVANPEAASSVVMPWVFVGGIGGLITALVTIFRPKSSGISAPIYAVFEGLLLGGLSALFESMYSGIVVRAVALTLAVFAIMLFVYRSGIIKVNRKFMLGVVAATGGIALVYFVSFIAGMFGANLSFLHGSGTFSIGFSLVVVGDVIECRSRFFVYFRFSLNCIFFFRQYYRHIIRNSIFMVAMCANQIIPFLREFQIVVFTINAL